MQGVTISVRDPRLLWCLEILCATKGGTASITLPGLGAYIPPTFTADDDDDSTGGSHPFDLASLKISVSDAVKKVMDPKQSFRDLTLFWANAAPKGNPNEPCYRVNMVDGTIGVVGATTGALPKKGKGA